MRFWRFEQALKGGWISSARKRGEYSGVNVEWYEN